MEIDLNVLIHQLKLFFLMMLAGYGASVSGLLTSELHDRLNTIIMRIILPALLISNMALGGGAENHAMILPMLLGGFVLFLFLFLCGFLTACIFRMTGDRRKVQIGIMTFGSTGFFGIPLAAEVLGPVGTAAFGIYSIADNLMVWTLGLSLSTGGHRQNQQTMRDKLSKLAQPATAAVFVGLILFFLEIPKDLVLLEALERIGSCANPLAMVCIGASIARSDVRKLYRGWRAVTVIFVKMLLSPVLVFLAGQALGLYEPALICLTFAAAIPTSSMFALMCKENGNEEADNAARASIWTVLGSMVTIPLVVSVISNLS